MPIQTKFAAVAATLSKQAGTAWVPQTLQHATLSFTNVVIISVSSACTVTSASQANKGASSAAVTRNSRGVKLKSERNLDGAVASYREAIGFAPDRAPIWLNLGKASIPTPPAV